MRVVNLRKEKYTVYIGRGSVFGNPFKIGINGDRKKVIKLYKEWIKYHPEILKAIYALPKDAILGCFCVKTPIDFIRKNKFCHGEVILELYNNHWGIK